MAYVKNTAGQQIVFAVIDSTTGNVVSGDAANISGVYSTDGSAAGLMGNSAVEIDSAAMPGFYKMALRQIETDGDVCLYRLFSSTTNARIDPVVIYPVVYSDYQANTTQLATSVQVGIVDGKCTSILNNTNDIETKVDTIIATGGTGPWTTATVSVPTVQQIVDGVWDEPTANHVTSGTTGKSQKEIDNISFTTSNTSQDVQSILQIGGAGPWTTATTTSVIDIVNGVWGATASNYNVAGTMGRNQNRIPEIETDTNTIITTGGTGPWTTGSGTTPPTVQEIVDGVWDEDIASHTTTNTFGNAYITSGGGLVEADLKRINQDQPSVDSLKRIFRTYDIETDVSNASADTVTFNDPSISSIDDFYTGMVVLIHGGTGVGQARQIVAYDGGSKKATVTPPWGQQPQAGSSDCTIVGGNHLPGDVWDVASNDHASGNTFGALLNRIAKTYGGIEGVVDGSSTTTTINSSSLGAYAPGAFDGQLCVITSGALLGEARPILSMNTASLTFEEPWTSAPAIATDFVILPQHVHPISEIADGVWSDDNNGATYQETLNSIEANTDDIISTGGPGPWTTGGGGGGGGGGDSLIRVDLIEPQTLRITLSED